MVRWSDRLCKLAMDVCQRHQEMTREEQWAEFNRLAQLHSPITLKGFAGKAQRLNSAGTWLGLIDYHRC